MKIRRMDLVLALAVLAAALVLFLLLRPADSPGGWAVVTVDGVETGRYSLREDRTVRIGGETGYNILEIRDGAAAVTGEAGDKTQGGGGDPQMAEHDGDVNTLAAGADLLVGGAVGATRDEGVLKIENEIKGGAGGNSVNHKLNPLRR